MEIPHIVITCLFSIVIPLFTLLPLLHADATTFKVIPDSIRVLVSESESATNVQSVTVQLVSPPTLPNNCHLKYAASWAPWSEVLSKVTSCYTWHQNDWSTTTPGQIVCTIDPSTLKYDYYVGVMDITAFAVDSHDYVCLGIQSSKHEIIFQVDVLPKNNQYSTAEEGLWLNAGNIIAHDPKLQKHENEAWKLLIKWELDQYAVASATLLQLNALNVKLSDDLNSNSPDKVVSDVAPFIQWLHESGVVLELASILLPEVSLPLVLAEALTELGASILALFDSPTPPSIVSTYDINQLLQQNEKASAKLAAQVQSYKLEVVRMLQRALSADDPPCSTCHVDVLLPVYDHLKNVNINVYEGGWLLYPLTASAAVGDTISWVTHSGLLTPEASEMEIVFLPPPNNPFARDFKATSLTGQPLLSPPLQVPGTYKYTINIYDTERHLIRSNDPWVTVTAPSTSTGANTAWIAVTSIASLLAGGYILLRIRRKHFP